MIGRDEERRRPEKASWIKVRYIIVVLATLCPCVCYISRQNLSMAMVALAVEPSESKYLNIVAESTLVNGSARQVARPVTANDDVCLQPVTLNADGLPLNENQTSGVVKVYGPKYDWSASDSSLIFEAFFITYVICQIPATRFSEVVGAG